MSYTPLEIADAFIHTGELYDALDALTSHLTDNPHDDAALRLRAQVRLRQGSDALSAALRDMNALHNLTADDHALLSVIHERLNDYPSAIAAARRAFSISRDERHAERLTDLYLATQHYSEALSVIRRHDLDNWRWLQREADILVLLGDDIAAADRYGAALAQLAGHFDLTQDGAARALMARMLIARAHVFRRLGQLEDAERDYAAAAKSIPDDPAVTFNRGIVAALQGDESDAVEYCDAALKAAPPMLRREFLAELDAPELASVRAKLSHA